MEIKEVIQAGVPGWIKEAKEKARILNVHVNGRDVAAHLDKIERYENKTQYDLRQRFATSNKFTYANILRPVDKVFSARGGSKIYRTKTEAQRAGLMKRLAYITDGMHITQWIRNVQMNKLVSDPNGFVLFEWKDDETYPVIKTVANVFNYEVYGREIEWVVFMPEKRKVDGKQLDGDFYRVIDKDSDRTIWVNNNQFTEVKEEVFKNPWGRVPAILNSPIINDKLQYKDTPIDNSIELAEHYLRSTSIKNIYEFLHGYPIYWEYSQKCKVCDGTGIFDNEPCRACSGSGRVIRKDVSDGLKLKIPQDGEPKLAPDVAGYVQPDLQTWEQMRAELDWIYALMYYTEWGTTQEKEANETATGRFIDSQSVNDRLNAYADIFEDLEKRMTDFVGEYYYGDNYEGSSINYGRRYLIEPPDVVWKKYETARSAGAPQSTLDYLLIQFYQTEFANDIEGLAVQLKAIRLEPFVHYTTGQVISLLPEPDQKRKLYFSEWYKMLSQDDILKYTVEILNQQFTEYINTKQNEVSGISV